MIRFGPSGIPLSCKGRTLEDGIKDVHKLGLNAFEVQFLRPKVRTRPVEEEEVGLKAKEVPEKFVIGVNKGREYREIFVEDLDKELKRGDMLHSVTGGVAAEFHKFPRLARLSKELDIKMSLHTPYYIELSEKDSEPLEKSQRAFKYSAVMADQIEAGTIITHLGLRKKDQTDEYLKNSAVENLRELRDWISQNCETDMKIGLETQTGEDVFGNLDETLDVCSQVSGTVPVVNFAHIKAEEEYPLDDTEDFAEIFDMCKKFVSDEYYVTFSGVEKRRRDECRLTPIKRGDLQFEDLVYHLIATDENVTIVSTSPLKEHDAMYMKVIFERIYSREIGKELRQEDE
ncbi:MAG: AP endonuclease [Candidatus Thermoplasmatota archaeon]|nr:AP endonuclease [Candidatus Thermoplasmatota archaeon]MBS3789571.1 AP endonuclease [Candidatus Thermoplasmatota archaeon]